MTAALTAEEEVVVLRRAAEGGAFDEAGRPWFDSGSSDNPTDPTEREVAGCRLILDHAALVLGRPPLDPDAAFDVVTDVLHLKMCGEPFEDVNDFWARFVPKLVALALELP